MTSMLFSRILVATGASFDLSLVAKVTLLLSFAFLAVRFAETARASVRHMLLAATFSVLAILPIVTVVMPPVAVDIPISVIESSDLTLSNVDSDITATPKPGGANTATGRESQLHQPNVAGTDIQFLPDAELSTDRSA